VDASFPNGLLLFFEAFEDPHLEFKESSIPIPHEDDLGVTSGSGSDAEFESDPDPAAEAIFSGI